MIGHWYVLKAQNIHVNVALDFTVQIPVKKSFVKDHAVYIAPLEVKEKKYAQQDFTVGNIIPKQDGSRKPTKKDHVLQVTFALLALAFLYLVSVSAHGSVVMQLTAFLINI